MPRFHARLSQLFIVASALILSSVYAAQPAPTIYAVTPSNNLLTFNSATPGTIQSTVAITGLGAGETVRAIDIRPSSGVIFAIAGFDPNNPFYLYTIDPTTGVATKVGKFADSLSGTAFGMDFNPVTDQIRVVIDATQNFRVKPTNGGTVDGDPNTSGTQPDTPLAYAAADTNFGQTPSIIGCAFTNNFSGATTTTLFGIDSTLNTLVRQGSVDGTTISPDSGQLTTIGALGIDIDTEGGLDISSTNVAYAALATSGATTSGLYTIDLATGAATLVGAIGGTELIRDIAIAPAGALQFTSATLNASEAAGTINVTVQRVAGTDGTVHVDFATSDGTAIAGTDYTATSGTLTFNPGETSKTFAITVANDNVDDPDETINLTLSNPDGGATLLTPSTAVLTLVTPPNFTNFAVASGAANAALNIPLTTSGSGGVTFSAVGLPSGLSITGNAITGTATTSGIFDVQLTATNLGGSAQQNFQLIITGAGISNSEVDVDGDGFPDEIENAPSVNTSATSATSTPFGGVPAGTVQQLNVAKLQIKLNFAKPLSDSIAFNGVLTIPAGFSIDKKTVVTDVGGVVKSFLLDAKGASPKGNDTFKLQIKATKGVVQAQQAKYKASFKKGDFAALLADEGLTNVTVSNQARTVPVIVLFNDQFFKQTQPQTYTAKFFKGGKTAQPK